ncbi:insulinase family protein, partial [Vibrio parahaemolyticus]|uniref:M16 family metallopeptidase n=1 Tax=Vibrio parahaemolyticus TaxID=670 RepID=UPI00146C6806
STTYDFIQITASSRPEEFLTLIESIANAVANPTIDKPTVETLKKAQIERIANLEKNPSYVGEQYALARLFGNFPYGRPVSGSIKSVEKLEFADIIDARQRFLTADKASLAISGSVDANLALRAVRRYFGAWTKADRQIP